jgi:hypothetical protein
VTASDCGAEAKRSDSEPAPTAAVTRGEVSPGALMLPEVAVARTRPLSSISVMLPAVARARSGPDRPRTHRRFDLVTVRAGGQRLQRRLAGSR